MGNYLEIIGNCAPNIFFLLRPIYFLLSFVYPKYKTYCKKKTACSCYVFFVPEENKAVVLDCGAGTLKDLLKKIKSWNLKLKELIIILSHNHVDHSFDMILLCMIVGTINVFTLILKLITFGMYKRESIKIKIYLPKKSIMYWFIKLFPGFVEHVINEDTTFCIGKYNFTFCRTDHRGECYATKVTFWNEVFIYTGDMASVTKKLANFCRNADKVMIDSGHPHKCEFITLKGYHSITRESIIILVEAGVKIIELSHFKVNLKIEEYLKVIPKEILHKIKIAVPGKKIKMFRRDE